jgi:hypothetical protein
MRQLYPEDHPKTHAQRAVALARAINQIVFLLGVLLCVILVVEASGKATLSEEFLLYSAIASYGLYLLSAATLTISIANATTASSAFSYLAAMLPSVLLISWLPITVAWPQALAPGTSWAVKLIACIANDAAFCYASAWVLVWLSKRLARLTWLRWLTLSTTAIVLPLAFWVIQVVLVQNSRGSM